MVDAEFLERMPPQSLLANVSRGPVVVTDDLVAAISSRRLRAALDVVDPEPLPPDHPLWTLEDVLITPHVGGNTAVPCTPVLSGCCASRSPRSARTLHH